MCFIEIPVDTSKDVDRPEQNIRKYIVGRTKRVTPSSSKGYIQRKKKSKRFVDDHNLHDYMAMMANNVAQVANAI